MNCLPLRPSYLRIQQFNYSRESWHFQFKFPTLARQDFTVPFPWIAREGDVEASNWSAQKKLHSFQAQGRGQGWKLCIALTPSIAAMALALTRYSDYRHHWQGILDCRKVKGSPGLMDNYFIIHTGKSWKPSKKKASWLSKVTLLLISNKYVFFLQ